MKYKAVIYDLDGTLLDTMAMNMYPLMRVIEEVKGENKTYEEVKHFFGMSGKQTLEALDIDYDKYYSLWVKYVNEYEQGAVPFDGVYELLEEVKQLGYVQAVVSSKTYKQYDIDVDKNMDLYFETKVLIEDTKLHKPNKEPMVECLKRLNIQPHEAIYVGDTLGDSLCCKASGVDFVWANWMGLENDKLKEYIELKHPLDLLKVLNDKEA